MSQPETQPRHAGLARRLADTRAFSETLCEPLTAEDMGLQACPEVSPRRWHLAHTTWFFETFILKPFAPGYKPSDERFGSILELFVVLIFVVVFPWRS